MIHPVRFLALPLTLLCASATAAKRLGGYPVDPARVSAAGASSGALMINQLHIAHSAAIMGAAMIAGSVYGFKRRPTASKRCPPGILGRAPLPPLNLERPTFAP